MAEYTKEQQCRRKPKVKKVVEYKQATDAARDKQGVIHCADCEKPLLDHQAQRHHIKFRSQGGTSEAKNLKVLCMTCHEKIHAHRK